MSDDQAVKAFLLGSLAVLAVSLLIDLFASIKNKMTSVQWAIALSIVFLSLWAGTWIFVNM